MRDTVRIQKKSLDGKLYEVLQTPTTISLVGRSYSAHIGVGSSITHHIYVEAETIKTHLLPLDANPREPSGKSPQVAAMQDTLLNTPSKFHEWNNGVTLVCENVQWDSARNMCDVTFSEREGICNGGHTYFAIVTTQFPIKTEALVHLEMIELPQTLTPQEKRTVISDIAQARNNNTRLAQISQADYQGYYNPFKKHMSDETLVIWHEGDSKAKNGAIRADYLVRLLAALDPNWYYHPVFNPNGDTHKSAVLSPQTVHNRWYEAMEDQNTVEKRLGHMGVLVDDMLRLRDHISYSVKNDNFPRGVRSHKFYKEWWLKQGGVRKLLTDDSKEGIGFPNTVDALLIGLLRTDVWLGLDKADNVHYVGWYLDPFHLWQTRRVAVIQALIELFVDSNYEPTQFVRAAGPYRNDLFVVGTVASVPDPEIVIDVETGERFVRDSVSPSHYLDRSVDIAMTPLPATGISSGIPTYKKV